MDPNNAARPPVIDPVEIPESVRWINDSHKQVIADVTAA